EVLWDETLGLEGRGGYYDRAGALKDVVQNHVMQLLAVTAMDLSVDDRDLHEHKLQVLKSVCAMPTSRRARYTAGTLADGREVVDYADESGVVPAHGTETFAELALQVETPRWDGTRFVLRAGKALDRQRKLVR